MCGFVAILGPNATEVGLVERGIEALKHRGPDGQGSWRSACGRVALGHARLAIIDLSPAGAQPMTSHDGRGVIAFNGEIYNYAELRDRVDGPFRSTSDTEVLLELLRKFGPEALPLLRGMFAFAYWDGEKLHVVRDRLGIKPVFYAKHAGCLYVASEIQALLAMGVAPIIDETVKECYLSLLYVPPPATGLVGVFSLDPAHRMEVRVGEDPSPARYWSLPPVEEGFLPSIEAVERHLEDAVRCHLVSDVPVGVFLSGGLDSSLIVALASKYARRPLKTFTVVFGDEGGDLDERRAARLVAERFGTEHHELQVTSELVDRMPLMIQHFGQPFGNPTALLTLAVCEAARQHATVILAGDGGDEFFGGYPRYQAEQLAPLLGLVPQAARMAATRVFRSFPGRRRGSVTDRVERLLTAPGDKCGAGIAWSLHSRSDEAEAYLRSRTDGSDSPLRRDAQTFLPHNVLAYGDRMSMAASVEVRVPFCDHVLVEYLSRVADGHKFSLFQTKRILRAIARKCLPAGIANAPKRGFNPPIHRWMGGAAAPTDGTAHGEWALRVWQAWRAQLAVDPGWKQRPYSP